MDQKELENNELLEMSSEDAKLTEGGFIFFLGLVLPYALQATVVGTLAMGVYASYEAGYNQAVER